jgi:hypothetical protein
MLVINPEQFGKVNKGEQEKKYISPLNEGEII